MAEKRRRIASSRFAVIAFAVLSVCVLLAQQFDFQGAARQGLLVPDVVNVARTLGNLGESGDLRSDDNDFIGVTILYGWVWLLHPSLCWLINMAMVLFAAATYLRRIAIPLGVPAWSVIGVVGNPYLMLASPGPNKEIPLLLLTILWWAAVQRRRPMWWLQAILLALAMQSFRGGYGLFMIGLTALVSLTRGREAALPVASLVACILAAAAYPSLTAFLSVFSRNQEAFEFMSIEGVAVGAVASALVPDPLSPIGSVSMFALRALYNAVSLALFPVLSTADGDWYWIGIGYWLFGLAILCTLPAAIWTCVQRNPDGRDPLSRARSSHLVLLSGVVLSVWMMISVSQFVQPRYLMPMLPLAVAVAATSPRRVRQTILSATVVLTCVVVGGYAILGRSPAPAEPEEFDAPPYVLVR